MKDARFPAIPALVGRAFRRKPQTYRQAWLCAAGVALAWLTAVSIFGIPNRWQQPWLALATEGSAVILILQGLALSYDVHRRRERARRRSTGA